MYTTSRQRTLHSLGAKASTLLWGMVEVIALARSRWSLRRH